MNLEIGVFVNSQEEIKHNVPVARAVRDKFFQRVGIHKLSFVCCHWNKNVTSDCYVLIYIGFFGT